jgi:AcrR family transcriptional regulator
VTPSAPPAPSQDIDERIAALAAEVATHRHGRVPAELRRAHIVAVAFALFAERGYADASMDELALRAGVSKPVIYGLAGDKERLFRACVEIATDSLASQVRTAMRAERDPAACLRAGARAFFEFVAESGPGWDRLMAAQGGPVSAELATARRRQADVVAELLGELLASLGAPVDTTQVEAVAHAMNGACEALALWWRRHPERGLDELVELAGRLVAPGVLDVAVRPLDRWGPEGPEEQT